MRIVRLAALIIGGLLALLLVGILAVVLFVDPNRYRGDIQNAARQHTDRELLIRGKLDLSFFPWFALGVHDAQLSNRPGFGDEPFMTVQNASIGVAVLPLLSGRLEVSRIRLDGVQLNLVSRGAQNNWQDLGESEESGPPRAPGEPKQSGGSAKPGESGKPGGPGKSGRQADGASGASGPQGQLSIEGVDLSKFTLVYRNEVNKSSTQISNAELHLGPLQAGPAGFAVGSLELHGTYLAQGPAAAGPNDPGHAPSAGRNDAGHAPPARPSDAGHSSGEPKPLAFLLRTSALTLQRATQAMAPVKAELQVGDSTLTAEASGEKMYSEPLVTGSVAIPTTSARKLLQSLGIAPPVTRDSAALAAVGLQTNFRWTHPLLQLSSLQMTLDDTRIQGTAAIDLDHSAVSFDLGLNTLNLDRYRAPIQKDSARRSPEPAKQPPTPLPLESLGKLNVHGTVRGASVTVSNLLFTDLVIPLAAQDGHIRLGPTQAHLYGGSCEGDIQLDAGSAQAELSLNEHVHGTDIGALVKAAFDSTRLSGRADVNVAMKGSGSTDEALIRSLSGKIDANVKQGALNGVDIVYELQRVNALLQRQVPPQRTGPVQTVFKALQANGTLDKAILRIDDLRIETDFLKVHGGGTLDTVTEAINYQLVASVNKLQPTGSPANEAGSGLDALKSVEVPLSITGTLSRPAVRPDIGALAKGKLGQEVQQQAVERVKKKLGDKLKDLLGH